VRGGPRRPRGVPGAGFGRKSQGNPGRKSPAKLPSSSQVGPPSVSCGSRVMRVGPRRRRRQGPTAMTRDKRGAKEGPTCLREARPGYLNAIWPEIFGLVFPGFSAEAGPRDPPRSPGPAPHINFQEKSAPQTHSNAILWHPKNPARLPSSTQPTRITRDTHDTKESPTRTARRGHPTRHEPTRAETEHPPQVLNRFS